MTRTDRRWNVDMWALAARMSLAPTTWIAITVLSTITVSTRALERELSGMQAVVYISASLAEMPIVLAIAAAVMRRHPASRAWVIGCALGGWIGAAVLRITVESALASAFDAAVVVLPPRVYVAQLVTPLLWAVFLGVVQAVNVARIRSILERKRLVDRLTMTAAERWRELDLERTVLADHVTGTIRPAIDRIRVLLADVDPGSASDLLGELGEVAEQSREVVRRASRETSELASRSRHLDSPRRSDPSEESGGWHIADLDTAGWTAAPAAVLVGMLVTFAPLFLGRATGSNWWFPPLFIAGAVLFEVLIIAAATPIIRRVGRVAAWLVIITGNLVACGAAAILSFLVVERVIGSDVGPRYPFATLLAFLLSAAVVTLAQVWEQERRDLAVRSERLVRLEEELIELDSDTEAEYERVCQHTSRLLHGPIQGRLAAIAMMLQLSSGDDGGVSPATLATCRNLADACVADLDILVNLDRSPPPVEEAMRSLRGRWLGLLSLRWYFQPEARALIDGDMVLRVKLEDFVADCATNACRHGAARRITVSARVLDSDEVELAAEDDGRGPTFPLQVGSGLGGLGRQGIDWSIETGARGGCVVRCRLATAASVRSQALAAAAP